MRNRSNLWRCLVALPLISVGVLAASGCAVDATHEGQAEGNVSHAPIAPLSDADRFPVPQAETGDTEKACAGQRADWVDDTWLAWGPFPQGGNFGWPICGHFCPAGSYAYSLQLKSEKWLQGDGDDTAMNGIAMDCYHKFPDTNGNAVYTGTITSQVGAWGDWGTRGVCPSLAAPIMSGKVTDLELAQGGGDDTALNKIQATCKNGTVLQPSARTTFGGPIEQDPQCQAGSAVCGIMTQLEPNQGGGDDTALNGGVFLCCTF